MLPIPSTAVAAQAGQEENTFDYYLANIGAEIQVNNIVQLRFQVKNNFKTLHSLLEHEQLLRCQTSVVLQNDTFLRQQQQLSTSSPASLGMLSTLSISRLTDLEESIRRVHAQQLSLLRD